MRWFLSICVSVLVFFAGFCAWRSRTLSEDEVLIIPIRNIDHIYVDVHELQHFCLFWGHTKLIYVHNITYDPPRFTNDPPRSGHNKSPDYYVIPKKYIKSVAFSYNLWNKRINVECGNLEDFRKTANEVSENYRTVDK